MIGSRRRSHGRRVTTRTATFSVSWAMSSVSLVDGSSERLRLHVGTVRATSTCRRTDTQGVLAVRKADPATLHKSTKGVAV